MDWKKLITRTISGVIYCALIVLAILWGIKGVILLAIALSTLACIEFAKITHDLKGRAVPALMLDLLGCYMLCTGFTVFALVLWIAVMIARIVEEIYINSSQPLRDLAHSFMSQIYIGVPMMLMVTIADWFDPNLILALFFFIWINDTGAYVFGSMFGRHKLFERISPKKTWEGFIGGVVFTLAAAAIFSTYCSDFFGMNTITAGNHMGIWLGFAALVSIFGTWGDLLESMIKRNLHIKDSGNLIPGHGGILDRIDSLLLALPAIAVYFTLITL